MRDRSQSLAMGADAKRGILQIFDLAWKKKYHRIFWRLKGVPRKMFAIFVFVSGLPLQHTVPEHRIAYAYNLGWLWMNYFGRIVCHHLKVNKCRINCNNVFLAIIFYFVIRSCIKIHEIRRAVSICQSLHNVVLLHKLKINLFFF